MNQDDESIWRNIQQKDLKTFERYYKEHYKSFFLIACKYLEDSNLAEEVVNDVFMKIWEDGNNISVEVSLKSYIYRAVINRSINLLQKIKKEQQLQEELPFVFDQSYEMMKIEENELAIMLYAAIDNLPQQCRKVFELSRFEHLKQQEIADQLGISIKTVKNHITHALKELNKNLDNYMIIIILTLLLIEIFNTFK
jgi:RNA polymerase sigma-70 factor (family 1)